MKKASYALLALLVLGGAYLLGAVSTQRAGTTNSSRAARTVLYYVDPMHPAYKSDKPGIAPDCGMELVPVYKDGTMGSSGPGAASLPPGTVNVSPEKQQLIGVRVGPVERAAGTRTLRTLGRVTLDETRVFRVTVPVDGLVREAGPIVTGDLVQKDELLATFYNRDFLTAQQTYLYALNTMDRFKNKEGEEQLKATRAQMQAAEENLEFLGMGKTQLQEVARTRQIARNIQLRSLVEGLVLARNVFPGLRFDRSTELFRIGDISHVWIQADVFEQEEQHLKPGTVVRVSMPTQQKTFQAKVSRVLPQFDGTTRTLKVRLETDNPGYVLRPDMFVDVEFPIALPPTIAVPADAVVDSGVKKTVYVDKGNGVFEPRKVETGWRAGDQVEIVKGLMVGEKIVVSGTFLLDSESRMKAAAAGIYGETSEDPVCGMDVDQSKAKAAGRTVDYKGQTYYFCSDDCKTKFTKEPTKYSWKSNPGATTPAGKRLGEAQWEEGKAKEKESTHVGHMHPPASSAGKSAPL